MEHVEVIHDNRRVSIVHTETIEHPDNGAKLKLYQSYGYVIEARGWKLVKYQQFDTNDPLTIQTAIYVFKQFFNIEIPTP